MQYVRNRTKIEFLEKDDSEVIFKQQLKLTFIGLHKSQTNYDSHALKQNEVPADLSRICCIRIEYVTYVSIIYYNKLQP